MSIDPANEDIQDKSSLTAASLASLLLAVALGVLGALVFSPSGIFPLAQSLVGASPKAYWYLSPARSEYAPG